MTVKISTADHLTIRRRWPKVNPPRKRPWFTTAGYLSGGNDGVTLVMEAINSLTMLLLYGVLGCFLLGVGGLPVPWQALLLSIGICVALPLFAGYLSRRWIISANGDAWFHHEAN